LNQKKEFWVICIWKKLVRAYCFYGSVCDCIAPVNSSGLSLCRTNLRKQSTQRLF